MSRLALVKFPMSQAGSHKSLYLSSPAAPARAPAPTRSSPRSPACAPARPQRARPHAPPDTRVNTAQDPGSQLRSKNTGAGAGRAGGGGGGGTWTRGPGRGRRRAAAPRATRRGPHSPGPAGQTAPAVRGEGRDVSSQYGGGTRRVQSVRGEGQTAPAARVGEGEEGGGWEGVRAARDGGAAMHARRRARRPASDLDGWLGR